MCDNSYYGIDNFHDHKCNILHKNTPIREFEWMVPITGLLHFEMNAARCFVSTNWDIFTSELGHELGFQSPKVQDYLKKGSDHHKLWHFLEILYLGISQELVTTFVKECIENKSLPLVDSYW